MDKRWIYILIIFIVGFVALFYIVESSTTVGSAIVAVDKYLTTVPDSYNIEKSDHNYANFINRETNERIMIESVGKGDLVEKRLNEELDKLQNNVNITKINITTEKCDDIIFSTVFYEKFNNSQNFNKIMVFEEFNHTFFVKATDFNNLDNLNEKAYFVIDALHQDFKKKQD